MFYRGGCAKQRESEETPLKDFVEVRGGGVGWVGFELAGGWGWAEGGWGCEAGGGQGLTNFQNTKPWHVLSVRRGESISMRRSDACVRSSPFDPNTPAKV